MFSESAIYDETLISNYLPTALAKKYLNYCLTAGWHRCNKNYFQKYDCGVPFVFVLQTHKGMGWLRAGGKTWELRPGSIAIVPAGISMEYGTCDLKNNSTWEFYWLNIDGQEVRRLAQNLWEDCCLVHMLRRPQGSCRIFEELLRFGSCIENAEFERSSKIRMLLDQIIRDFLFDETGYRGSKETVEQILRYLQQNYYSNISLSELSAKFYLSKNQVIRSFCAFTGYTPYEYLKQYRLIKACEILQTTNMPVRDVGRLVGYSNNSHFSSQFRIQYGTTPMQYRNKFISKKQ